MGAIESRIRLVARGAGALVSVAIRADEWPGAAPNEALAKLCAEDLVAVNALILRHMQSEIGLIPQLASHIIASGGKRLRPLLTLACARLCGYQGKRHLGLAAVVEFIHTATLLHDDVVDKSGLRRGRQTANDVWGNKASVLVGDFLFSRAFQLMVSDGSLQVLSVLAQAAATIAEGEVHQLMTSNDTETGESAYLQVVTAKTAALFAAASQVGALVADRPGHEAEALHSFGLNLGIAFQLVDDVLDYSSASDEMGKATGDDFRDGKITLPVVLAFKVGNAEERVFWRRTLEELKQRDGDLRYAVGLLHRHGALTETVARARTYGEHARRALSVFPDGPACRALMGVVDAAIDRAR